MKSSHRKTATAKAGSPPIGEPEYLVVGFLRRPHGLKGELLMDIRTDFPERLKEDLKVFIGEQYKPMTIANCRPHAKGKLISFHQIDSPEKAGQLRNTWVYVPVANLPELPEGEYYHHQLLGLSVITEDNQELGMLTDIIETGANDVYVVVDSEGKETLLPAIPAVILDINLSSHQMRVHLLEGLI